MKKIPISDLSFGGTLEFSDVSVLTLATGGSDVLASFLLEFESTLSPSLHWGLTPRGKFRLDMRIFCLRRKLKAHYTEAFWTLTLWDVFVNETLCGTQEAQTACRLCCSAV